MNFLFYFRDCEYFLFSLIMLAWTRPQRINLIIKYLILGPSTVQWFLFIHSFNQVNNYVKTEKCVLTIYISVKKLLNTFLFIHILMVGKQPICTWIVPVLELYFYMNCTCLWLVPAPVFYLYLDCICTWIVSLHGL